MGAGLRSPVSSVYRWQGARRDKRDVIDLLRSHGYEGREITALEVRLAEAYPDKWRKSHRHVVFDPADVPGL